MNVTGTPSLKIDMDPADWGEKQAAYESGSGSASLVFAHEVVEPNRSTQGIAVLADTLSLNGGSIKSASSDTDAELSHAGLAHDAEHKVNWQISAPTVSAVAITSDAGDDDTYALGDNIQITLTFSEAVDVTGTPQLDIDMDPADWGEKQAAYHGGSGSAALTFTHTVVEPNLSTQGIALLADTLALNGGTIQSAAGQIDADLSHAGLAHDASHKVDWQHSPPATIPTVSAVAITSDAGDDDTYGEDDVIQITLTFSEAVDVSGSPQLTIKMDPDYGEKQAGYHSGSGTASLVFTHTVVEPNLSTPGIAVLADTLALNDGTIQSAESDTDANLSHTGLDHNAEHKVDWQAEPNHAPVINTQSAGYADFTFRGNAPRGILVSKRFDGIFSDPDGDNLTYSVALASDNHRLVGQLRVSDFGDTDAAAAQSGYPLSVVQRVYFEAEAEADWKAMNPQPPVQPVATVTLTATDPGGLTASVNGDFLIHWETYPELQSAVAGQQAITLTYDMAVLDDPAPTLGQFWVNVVNADGSTGTIAVSSLTVNGPVVTLALASELSEGQAATLDYANATKTPVRAANGWGHGAGWFRGLAVDMSQLEPSPAPRNFTATLRANGTPRYTLTAEFSTEAIEFRTSVNRIDPNRPKEPTSLGSQTLPTPSEAEANVGWLSHSWQVSNIRETDCGQELEFHIEAYGPGGLSETVSASTTGIECAQRGGLAGAPGGFLAWGEAADSSAINLRWDDGVSSKWRFTYKATDSHESISIEIESISASRLLLDPSAPLADGEYVSSTVYRLSGLDCGKTYDFTVEGFYENRQDYRPWTLPASTSANTGTCAGETPRTLDAPPSPGALRISTDAYSYPTMAFKFSMVSGIDKYQVEYRAVGEDDWAKFKDFRPTGNFSRSVRLNGNLACEAFYQFRVRARGDGTAYKAEWSSPTTSLQEIYSLDCPPPNAGAPAAPAGFSSVGGYRSATLSWDDPKDDSITKYQYRLDPVFSGSNVGVWTDIPNSESGTTSYTITGMPRRTWHRGYLRAVNEHGPGASVRYGSWLTADPIALPPEDVAPGTPAAPIAFSSTGMGFSEDYSSVSSMLGWNDPQDDSITKYQYRLVDFTNEGVWTDIPNSGADTTSYVITASDIDLFVAAYLRAANRHGPGAPSSFSWVRWLD